MLPLARWGHKMKESRDQRASGGTSRPRAPGTAQKEKRDMARPIVVITLEGGLVQDVRRLDDGGGVNALVIDFDTDGSDPAELTQVGRERSDLAYVSLHRTSDRARSAKRLMEVFKHLVAGDR